MKRKTNLRLMAVTGMVVLIVCGSAWADLADGLIAHWPLDDGEGLTAVDPVGGNDGTFVNGPIWVAGQVDGALEFDGTNDVVITPLNIDQSGSSTGITFSAWVYPTSSSTGRHHVVSSDDGGFDWSLLRDPVWLDSDAPIGICTPLEVVRRNITGAMDIKGVILEDLERALDKEKAAQSMLWEFQKDKDSNGLKKQEIIKTRMATVKAIIDENQSKEKLNDSIEKLQEAMDSLEDK